jgi:hypothetical protein
VRNNRAAAIAEALATLAAVIISTAASLASAVGGAGANRYLPRSHPDTRRGASHRVRAVDRVVIDQWLLWRK